MQTSNRTGALAYVVQALAMVDAAWLLEHPETPDLLSSGVRYVARGLNSCGDDWRDIPEILSHPTPDAPYGSGVCEDLTAWRIAELRVRHDVIATPVVTAVTFVSGLILYHVRVGLPDGTIEDIAEELGMT